MYGIYLSIDVPLDLRLAVNAVRGVKVMKDAGSRELIERVAEKLRDEIKLEDLKNHPVARAYRDFYWRIGIDPTKRRPSGEALVRRALKGGIPSINNVVDAGNIASMETLIPIGLYDIDRIKGDLKLRFASDNEQFLPIGGKEERLKENQIVLADDEKVLHVFPYRDSRETMITEKTRNVLVVACGVPNVEDVLVMEACRKAVGYIRTLAGGVCGECRLVTPGLRSLKSNSKDL